ncbi:MAG: ParB/RepB/Spo0J family partition protein [Alphaproteobacteria bacterium]|nr:ParB/RepB/Spo0J family partition protein [Alphaproteobacteria bacterium]
MSEIKKQVLGRGLSSLFSASETEEGTLNGSDALHIPIELIMKGIHQPRHFFPEDDLVALSVSIKEKGVLQPILVRPHPQDKDKFEIIAGERRWRAAKMAGFEHIPALIKEFSDAESLEVGLLENIQRQDLNPIEEADGYRRLAEEFNHTQESLSRILGKSRSHIANTLRLLTLPQSVKKYLAEGKLTAGHGRALISAEKSEELADLIVEKGLSVRQSELMAKKRYFFEGSDKSAHHPDPEKEILRQHLSDLLEIPVDLILKGSGGKIVISFKNPTELDHLLHKLNEGSPKKKLPNDTTPNIWGL